MYMIVNIFHFYIDIIFQNRASFNSTEEGMKKEGRGKLLSAAVFLLLPIFKEFEFFAVER